MLTKTTKMALGQHTAGIYADMSIDGPEIGTLVAIIDRAKNLPNRKTMGKQNPYCAARLGKEAKKTDTDMRGGQTPKWDQELRFTVHSSPDYYQLKLSVFNDDKKTDLIGETWVDLKNVIVPGGGQNDLWHNLQCKGKYAGELRMELTYYDTRPKDEAVIERRKEAAAAEKAERKGISPQDNSQPGARKTKGPRRRPLPSDPTGQSTMGPRQPGQLPQPQQPQPETQSQQQQALQAPSPDHPSPTRAQQIPSKVPHASQAQQVSAQHVRTPKSSRRYETPDDLIQQWEEPVQSTLAPAATQAQSTFHHQPEQPCQADYENAYSQHPPQPETSQPPPQQQMVTPAPPTTSSSSSVLSSVPVTAPAPLAALPPVSAATEISYAQPAEYSYEPEPIDPVQHHGQLQQVDDRYARQEPPAHHHSQQQMDNHHSQESVVHIEQQQQQQQQQMDNHYLHEAASHHGPQSQPDNHYSQALVAVNYAQNVYETPPRKALRQSISSDPRQNSGQHSYPPVSRASPYGTPDAYSRHASPETHQLQLTYSPSTAHHHYSSSIPRSDVFQESPLRNTMKQLDYHRPSSSHSHNTTYGQGHMQPQVHEADEEHDLPPPPPIHRDGLGRQPRPPAQPEPTQVLDLQLAHRSQPIPMPQPLNLGGSRNSHRSTGEMHEQYTAYSPGHSSRGYSAPPPNHNEQLYSTSPTPSYHSYIAPQEQTHSPERPLTSNGESIPSALLAGYDQQDIQPDLRLARRGSDLSMHQPTHFEEPSTQATPENRIARRQSYVPPQPSRSSPSPIPERKSVSPDPRQIPARKSLSPQPPPIADPDTLSGIPFGPDSYDSLNPGAALASAVHQPASPYETPEEAMEAARQHEVEKLRGLGPIIGNDGRVIDPSDHLPLDTWAPEPERKNKKPEVVVRFKHTSHTNTVGPRMTPRDRPRTSISSARQSYQSSSSPSNTTPPARPPKRITYIPLSSSPNSGSTTTTTDRPSSSHQSTNSPLRERENQSPNYFPPTTIMTPPHYRARQAQAQAQALAQSRAQTRGRSPSPSPPTHPRLSPSPSNYYEKSGPPIPAKVPIHPGSQNYPAEIYPGVGGSGDLDALTEEIKRIDIGFGKSSPGGAMRKARQSYVESYDYEK